MKGREIVSIALIALAIGASATFLVLERSSAAVATSAIVPTPTLTVTSATPRQVRWNVALDAAGSISPWEEASIGTQIGGYRLIEVRVNVGDQVSKDQVLAVLDPDLLLADEAQLQATYEQAAANEQRALTLQHASAISDKDVLLAITNAKTAAAALDAKRLQLRYTKIVAPDSGVISSRTATLGAVMPVGEELFRLIRANRLEWRGEVTAAQLTNIKVGQLVELTLPDGGTAIARVRQTAPSLDLQSRLGLVYADLIDRNSARAGMYASGRIVVDEASALVIPAESVVIRDGRSYVIKLANAASPTTVALQAVTVGRRQDAEVEVTTGLAADDWLVVSGAGFLSDGDVVRVLPDSAARQSLNL